MGISSECEQGSNSVNGNGNGNGNGNVNAVEVECVKCDSCGFTEECTPAYISRLRQRYQGRWLCGLCVEAVKDELLRSDTLISTEEALNRHISFCRDFRASAKPEHPLFAMARILRRSLDSSSSSPRPLRTNSTGALPPLHRVQTAPPAALLRSDSCFSSISGV
ncbi:uncharacterized protein LOC107457927 [Arachis duranensis]|uniref:Uncharacterized protein LOC107457927 n=1 Tax=Arachis duranensis TaxID=130453 RepID=A0A6P4BJT9_ARADU|nr:uncharacterized protein LOC107457927 [Arachis duranensis]